MSKKQFLPFITDDQGRSLVVENGVVVTKSIPTPQENSPEGWDGNSVQFQRNAEFRALIKTYVTDLKFFFDAAKIIKHFWYRFGTEIVLFFIWLKLDQTFGANMIHRGWYKGEIDLTSCRDGYDGIEVNLTEAGFYKELQANKGVPYEIPMDDETAVSLYMDGMHIYYQAKFLITNGTNITEPNYDMGNHVLEISTVSNEFESVGSVGEVPRTKITSFNLNSSNLWFLKATTDGTVTINYNFNVTVGFYSPPAMDPSNSWKITIRRVNAANVGVAESILINKNAPVLIPGTHLVAGTATINVQTGDKLYLYSHMHIEGAGGDAQSQHTYTTNEDSLFTVNFKFLKEATIIAAKRPIDIGNELCQKMSNGVSSLTSNLLENDDNLLMASGDNIRGIPGAILKTKFTDFHKSIDAVKCIAFGVENNNGWLEARQEAFTNTEIANLGQAKIPKTGFVTQANDLMYGQVEIGYPSKDIGDVNGKFQFITTSYYKAPTLKGERPTYDMKAPYYADPFIIELLRINLEQKNTTDNKSDSDVFFIDAEKVYADYTGEIIITSYGAASYVRINGTSISLMPGVKFKILNGVNAGIYTVAYHGTTTGGTDIYVNSVMVAETINTTIEFRHYKLRRRVYDSITGIPNPDTVFNIELTQARILRNHFTWLSGCFQFFDSQELKFQTQDKNKEVETTMGAEVITEKGNILIADMGTAYIQPRYLKFEVKSPYNLLDLMGANSKGYMTVEDGDNILRGYPEFIKTNDATLETQEYRLLCTADTDLTYRINE